jgi:hypothetical protein
MTSVPNSLDIVDWVGNDGGKSLAGGNYKTSNFSKQGKNTFEWAV